MFTLKLWGEEGAEQPTDGQKERTRHSPTKQETEKQLVATWPRGPGTERSRPRQTEMSATRMQHNSVAFIIHSTQVVSDVRTEWNCGLQPHFLLVIHPNAPAHSLQPYRQRLLAYQKLFSAESLAVFPLTLKEEEEEIMPNDNTSGLKKVLCIAKKF